MKPSSSYFLKILNFYSGLGVSSKFKIFGAHGGDASEGARMGPIHTFTHIELKDTPSPT
jgi:hypothetical protein